MMFGVNKDCPIRITGVVGYNKEEMDRTVKVLMDEFGWKIHSEVQLKTKESTVYSIILFNLRLE